MVAVIGNTGIRLMPTTNIRARRLLKSGRAVIHQYRPFTIRLLDCENGDTQSIEFKMDTGYQHIGVSVCTEKREIVSEQRDLLSDETEKHNDHRKYRGSRRNRKTRYRKPRWNNRKNLITKDGFAPSIRNKRDRHIDILMMYYHVMPITTVTIEMGQFDTQVLKAVAEGKPLPEGTDYQHGERYGSQTLREAVFTRDGYRCIICKRSAFKDKAVLHEHHVGYWKGDRTNRMSNLAAVCDKCHTSKSHKPGGKLYGLEPKLKSMADATFMTMVRYSLFRHLKESAPDVDFHMTYGAMTKLKRRNLGLRKSHVNDAYAMGEFHPKHRTDTAYYQKRRRNNRILEKFYDAKYTDIRDDSIKKGSQLSCGRTKRSISKNTELNERPFRGQKLSAGKRVIRTRHYSIRPHDQIRIDETWYDVNGIQNNGTYVSVHGHKPVSIKRITKVVHANGWFATTPAIHPTT